MESHVVALEFSLGVPAGPLDKVGALLLLVLAFYVILRGSGSAIESMAKLMWSAFLGILAIGGLMVLSDVRQGTRDATISGGVSIVPETGARLSVAPGSSPTQRPADGGGEVTDSFSHTHTGETTSTTDFTKHTHP